MSYLVIIYVSEGLKLPCFQTLKSQFSSKTALLAHSFKDVVYNRTSFYFVGHDMLSSIYGICNELFSILNFSNHNGLHPTLGAVDHICFSPLGQTQIEQTAVVANEFAKAYAELNEIPVFMYGQASSSGRQLKNLRSELGYFKIDTTENQCPQVSSFYNVLISQGNLRQDYGPLQFNAQKGLTCIGTVPFVLNYNLRFRPQDSKKLVSQITKHVRSETVESLTLQHEDGAYEVACNLKASKHFTPSMIYDLASVKSQELGIEIVSHYTTGPTDDELLSMFNDHVSSFDN